VNKNSESKLIK